MCRVNGLVVLLGDVGEHGLALSRLEAACACLLEERLWLRSAMRSGIDLHLCNTGTYFFMMFLLRKVLSFCVAGDWISSDGETYFCALLFVSCAYCVCAVHSYCSSFMRDSSTCRWYSSDLVSLASDCVVGFICAFVSRLLSTLADIVACGCECVWV